MYPEIGDADKIVDCHKLRVPRDIDSLVRGLHPELKKKKNELPCSRTARNSFD